MTTSIAEARAAKETVKHLLAGVNGVSGIGVTWNPNGEPSVLVNVRKYATAKVKAQLSKETLDVPVVIEEIGDITFEKDKR